MSNWWNYNPKQGASWYWRKICQVKEHFEALFTVYDRLRGEKMDVMWDKVAWNRICIHKHRFITWLAVQSKLTITEKLWRIGVATSDKCKICDAAPETHSHLFFECYYNTQCLTVIKRWLGIQTSVLTLHQII